MKEDIRWKLIYKIHKRLVVQQGAGSVSDLL